MLRCHPQRQHAAFLESRVFKQMRIFFLYIAPHYTVAQDKCLCVQNCNSIGQNQLVTFHVIHTRTYEIKCH